MRKRVRDNSPVGAYHVMHASISGAAEDIATIEGEFGVPFENRTSFHVTADRKIVIASAYAPLIWDVLAARPRATPYDWLVPSATSYRYLGVEIDTRQLVLVDENFAIVERFAPTFQDDRRIDLVWSEDERYVICCTYRPYGSGQWDGFRLDLKTGAQGPHYSGVENDRFIFTGRGGEVVRLGTQSVRQGGHADGSDGSYVGVTPVGAGEEKLIHHFSGISREPEKGTKRLSYPPIVANRHAAMIAMALPRPAHRRAGFHYYLVDLAGKLVPFLPESDATYNTPYYPIAFVDGERIVARLDSTLFSLPLSAVAANDEARDDK